MDVEKEILIGIIMGDGCVNRGSSANPHIQVRMTNKEYLEWLDGIFGIYSNGVIHEKTPEESMEDIKKWDPNKPTDPSNYSDVYMWKTKSSPKLSFLADWYSSGKKKFDYSIEMTPNILVNWYVCDGTLNNGHRLYIISTNEIGEENKISRLFREQNLPEPTYLYEEHDTHRKMSIAFTKSETEDVMEYMCSSKYGIPPGFSYKFTERFK